MAQSARQLRLTYRGLILAWIGLTTLAVLRYLDVLPPDAVLAVAVLLAADGLLLALTFPRVIGVWSPATAERLSRRSKPWGVATYLAIVVGVLVITYAMEGYVLPQLPFTPQPAFLVGWFLILTVIIPWRKHGYHP